MSMIVKQAPSYLGHFMRAGGLKAATAVGKVAGSRQRGRQRSRRQRGRQRVRWLVWVTLEARKQLGELREVWGGIDTLGGVWLGISLRVYFDLMETNNNTIYIINMTCNYTAVAVTCNYTCP